MINDKAGFSKNCQKISILRDLYYNVTGLMETVVFVEFRFSSWLICHILKGTHTNNRQHIFRLCCPCNQKETCSKVWFQKSLIVSSSYFLELKKGVFVNTVKQKKFKWGTCTIVWTQKLQSELFYKTPNILKESKKPWNFFNFMIYACSQNLQFGSIKENPKGYTNIVVYKQSGTPTQILIINIKCNVFPTGYIKHLHLSFWGMHIYSYS